MLTRNLQAREHATLQPTGRTGGTERGLSCLASIVVLLIAIPSAFPAVTVTLQTSGGITITGANPNYNSSFGTMNALAIGTPQGGVTAVTCPGTLCSLANGALYFTTLRVTAAGMKPTDTGVIKAYVSTNFTGSAASAMQIYACPSPSACNAASQFSILSTTVATEATLASGLANPNNFATVGLAIFLPDNNGVSAFTGTASAILTFNVYLNGSGTIKASATLNLNNPLETVNDAVQLNLAKDPSGLTVTPAADFSMNFGNVNALGIGPGAGLTTVAQAGGIIYSTPYQLLPVFTGMGSTTSSLKVCVSTPFTNALILSLYDSPSGSAGTFNAITTSCISPPALTTSATNRSTVTRYLGLFVANTNGPSSFRGTDTAWLTYTLTVP